MNDIVKDNIIGKKIKFYRKQRGYTQAELAEKIGISEKHISKIELGAYIPTLINFIKIMEVLNLDFEDFNIYTKTTKEPQYKEIFSLLNESGEKEIKYYTKLIKLTKEMLL